MREIEWMLMVEIFLHKTTTVSVNKVLQIEATDRLADLDTSYTSLASNENF